MRHLIFILLTAVFFTTIGYAQGVSTSGSGWRWYNPSPMGNDVSSFSIAPDGTQYLCGSHGTLLKSTNDGLTFESMSPIGETELREIKVLETSLKIIVVGQDGARVSTNGGAVWGTALLGENLNCCEYKNGFTLVAGDNGKIYRSTDNGVLFNIVYNNPITDFKDITMLPNGNVIAAGTNGIMLFSSDNGLNFTPLNIAGSSTLKGVSFLNSSTGISVGTNSSMYKTTNGGVNWSSMNIGGNVTFNDVLMINENISIAAANGGDIYVTNNGGSNWQINYSVGPFDLLTMYAATGNVHVWGEGGVHTVSTNSGSNWSTPQSDRRVLLDIAAPFIQRDNPGDTLFACGKEGSFRKSGDGGLTWQIFSTGTTLDLTSLFFFDSQTGWAVGGKSSPLQRIILKTTNGGVNWFTQHSANSNNLYDIEFINQTTGLAVGNFGVILRTTNAGANWLSISGVTWTLQDIKFLDTNTGIAVGEAGRIFRTTNAGLNWIQVNSGSFFDMQFSVDFSDANTGISVGSQGTMYKTTNGGSSWVLLPSVTQNALYSFVFVNAQIGYACGTNLGNDCSVLKTTNSGLNWQRQNTGTNNILNSVYFTDINTGFIAGEAGTILKTTTGGNPIGIQKITGEIPKQYLLPQNYPNPFNPVTNIKFSLPKTSHVSLRVYDINGREIAVLVNQNMTPGTYNYDFNASNLSSGVFFYMLAADNFIETKKMVLIK